VATRISSPLASIIRSQKTILCPAHISSTRPRTRRPTASTMSCSQLSLQADCGFGRDHIFKPTFANSVRFGYNYENVDTIRELSPCTGGRRPFISHFSWKNRASTICGRLTTFPRRCWRRICVFYHWNTFQIYDDAFINKGTHTIKFGFAAERMELESGLFSTRTEFSSLRISKLSTRISRVASKAASHSTLSLAQPSPKLSLALTSRMIGGGNPTLL